jgi:hypothetical protein
MEQQALGTVGFCFDSIASHDVAAFETLELG